MYNQEMNQDAARPTDAAYRKLVEQTQGYAIIMLDPGGFIVSWNEGAQNIFGWTAPEVIGQHGAMIFTPEDRAAGVPEHELAVATEQGKAADNRWHLRKDGSSFWGYGIVTAHHDEAGEIESFSKILRDNSAIHDAEQQLKASKDFFELVTEALPDIVWTTSASGEVEYCNERWVAYTGLPRQEAYGLGWLEVIHPDDHAAAQNAWAQAIASGGPVEMEHRIRRKDGSYHWCITRGTYLQGKQGEAGRWFGTTTDIEEQKRTGLELQLRAKQQEVVAELGRFALSGPDLPTLMQEASRTVCETLQVDYCKVLRYLPEQEVLLLERGTGWREGAVGTAQVSLEGTVAGHALSTNEPVIVEDFNAQMRFRPSQLLKEHGVISTISTCIPGLQEPYGVLGSCTKEKHHFTRQEASFLQAVANILAEAVRHKETQEALAREQANLQTILYQMPSGLIIAEAPSGKVVMHNGEAERVLGHVIGSVELLDYEQFGAIHQDGTPYTPEEYSVARALSGETVRQHTMTYRRGDGHLTTLSVNAAPIRSPSGDIVAAVAIFQDVSERERATAAERKLELERALSDQLAEERRRLGRELHDSVRQQLIGVKMLAARLQQRLAERDLPEAVLMQEFADLLTDTNTQVRELIRDLAPPKIDAAYLPSALERAAREVEQWYGILCEVALPATTPLQSDEVANHLFYLAQEAMTNAAKHAKASRIELSLRVQDEVMVLQVHDDGEGLPEDFDRRGSLGITNMRYRAELMGAEFSITSGHLKGTTVTCLLRMWNAASLAD